MKPQIIFAIGISILIICLTIVISYQNIEIDKLKTQLKIQSKTLLKPPPKPIKYKVACIGDSITADGGYVKKLQKLCSTNYIFDKYGFSGKGTSDIIKHINEKEINLKNYDCVIFLMGVNNIGNVNQVTNDLNWAFATSKQMNRYIKVVACTLTPWGGYKTSTMAKQMNTLQVNDLYLMQNPQYADIVVDLWAPLSYVQYLQGRYDSGDGLHPSVEGHERIGELIYGQVFKE